MNYRKNQDLYSFRWLSKDFSRTNPKTFKKYIIIAGIVLLAIFAFIIFEIYIPKNPISHETITYTVPKGWGDDQIAKDLQKLGIIKSQLFFRIYATLSFKSSSLQAGKYKISSRMSVYQIAKNMAQGNVIKNTILIYEGWDIKDIGQYLESKNICSQADFIKAANKDYSNEFSFLKDLPRDKAGKPTVSLEGFLFPDTYQLSEGENCDDVVLTLLSNFDKKLTPDLRKQISDQKKSVFDIITVASMIEKEVKTLDDKKTVSGILWKRLAIGMPLQLDSTVNYITDRSDPCVSIKSTKIDSPYNTYKYPGLPKGPISNPGIGSIAAALNPKKTNYLFWLSDGITHFSETIDQHNAAKAKYLN